MIVMPNGVHIVEKLEDLPNLQYRKELFLDVETQRVFEHKDVGGMYPWKGDRICGFSVTIDNEKSLWYVPIRHTCPGANNLPITSVMQWTQDLLNTTEYWINHNVKFDAKFFHVDGVQFNRCKLVDTKTLTRAHNSDLLSYGLKQLGRDVLGLDISSLDRVAAYLKSIKSQSYADCPIDIMADYSCNDIRMNRVLYRYLQRHRPEEMDKLWETEIALTPVLFDMEVRGMRIDEQECKVEAVKSLRKMIDMSTKISIATEREFTNSNDCIYDILINQYGLPILQTIKERDEDGRMYDTGRPTFDKDTMQLYRVHPMVTTNEKLKSIVDAICEYRIESTFKSLYLDTFITLNVNGILHPDYNQSVKSGRMSCSKPNSQQQNSRSKSLIYPHEGFGFISNDYNQIEYRLIVHYIKDAEAIEAYNTNPDTDFHKWVAELLQNIDRDSAKQLNFGMAYGAGKGTVTKGLMANELIIKMVGEIIIKEIGQGTLDPKLQDKRIQQLCRDFASDAYDTYHERLPGIRDTAYNAMMVCKTRGYIFNAYGRRGNIPFKFAHKAFNRIIQSCAADVMKERLVALASRYNSASRALNLHIAGNVHDECLEEVPLELLYSSEVHKHIISTLQNTTVKFRVPIITGLGLSPNNWNEASGKATIRDEAGNFVAGRLK